MPDEETAPRVNAAEEVKTPDPSHLEQSAGADESQTIRVKNVLRLLPHLFTDREIRGAVAQFIWHVLGLPFKIIWELRGFVFKYVFLSSAAGCVLFLVLLLGSVVAVGFSAAWPLYRDAIVWIPLIGPAMVFGPLIMMGLLHLAARKVKNADHFLLIVFVVSVIGIGGYFAARSEYEKFQPATPDTRSLFGSADEQMATLGRLSASGTSLLNQLQTTEGELSEAKDQLRATLSTFEQQRRAASQVASQLKQLDERQRAIALRTQELERILNGKEPITAEDLRRSGNLGLLWGFILGVFASILANLLTSWVGRKNIKQES